MRRFRLHIVVVILSLGLLSSCSKGTGSPISSNMALSLQWHFTTDTISDAKYMASKIAEVDKVVLPYGDSSEVSWYLNQFKTPEEVLDKTIYLLLHQDSFEASVWVNSINVDCLRLNEDMIIANISGLLNHPSEINTLQVRLSGHGNMNVLRGVEFLVKPSFHIQSVVSTVVETNPTGCLVNFDVRVRNDSESYASYFLDLTLLDSKGKVVGTLRRSESIQPLSTSQSELPILVDIPEKNKDGSLSDKYMIKASLSKGDKLFDSLEYQIDLDMSAKSKLD